MDKELQKISSLITTIRELENRLYSIEGSGKESKRIRKYLAARYKYLWDWILED